MQSLFPNWPIYLPIAEMSINALIIVSMGAAVGFLSGLFGVGGGFLMTPLLIFVGVPTAVAVGTGAAQIVASSVSGALAHWRRNSVDFKMGTVLLLGGLVGSVLGVQLVKTLRRLGQFDVTVSLLYVTFLGVVGALMFIESVNDIRKVRQGGTLNDRRTHSWIHGLPLKMRFHKSKLYISAIPPVLIGIFVGLLAAVMGVGGGFVIIPAMIYLLRMPTNVVVGTSLFQIIFVTAATTLLHATLNQTVDVVLAGLLIVGGVIGAQLGAQASGRLRGEELRFLLALIVLLVCARVAWSLLVTPADLYSISSVTGGTAH